MSKKGQLTLYIIIGIIVLLIIGFTIYILTQEKGKDIEPEIPKIQAVSSELKPISDFITECVKKTGINGLNLLGSQGGYIDTSKLSYNSQDPTAKASNAILFSQEGSLVVPYWHYMSSDNKCEESQTCEFKTQRPFVYKTQGNPSFEDQLNKYINQNLKSCLRGFDELKEKGFDVAEKGNVETETIITKDAVYFKVNYPLEIRIGEKTLTIKQYLSEINLKLKDVYEAATIITNYAASYKPFEMLSNHLIDYFSGLSSSNLPPTYESRIGDSKEVFWIKSKVAKDVSEILQNHVPLVQVGGTANYHYITAPNNEAQESYELLYNRNFYLEPQKQFPELEISFSYLPEWKPYFGLNCKGELCRPETIRNTILFFFAIQRYAFAYDISFPVLVRIRSPSSLDGEGYDFQFFLETNIRNSEPLKQEFVPLPTSDIQLSDFCDLQKRTSGNVTINIIDAVNKKSINDADITYNCGKKITESCTIDNIENGTINTKFPKCSGGILLITKQGYYQFRKPFDAEDKQAKLDVALEPIRSVNIQLNKILLERTSNGWIIDDSKPAQIEKPNKDEKILVSLVRKGDVFDEEFASFVVLESGKDTANISLIPGNYDVKITSFTYPSTKLIIPPQKREIKYKEYGVIPKKESYLIPPEAIIFNKQDPYPSGGAELNWQVTQNYLTGKTIDLYYIGYDLSKVQESERVIEDLDVIGRFNDFSKSHEYLVQPTTK